MTIGDKQDILEGSELNDKHVNAAQLLLHKQYPSIRGLCSTLKPEVMVGGWVRGYVQIFHSRSNHWIVASTIGCEDGEVNIYNSLYTDVDFTTRNSIEKIFEPSKLKFTVPNSPKQKGARDCGLFSIAI